MKTLGIVAFILLISTAVAVGSPLPKPHQIGTGIGGIENDYPGNLNDEKDKKVIDWIFNSTLTQYTRRVWSSHGSYFGAT